MDTTQANLILGVLGRSSVEAGILVLLVLAARWLFRKQLTPQWRCALWLLVAIRLLLPFSFSSVTSVFNLLPAWTPPSSPPSSPPPLPPPAPAVVAHLPLALRGTMAEPAPAPPPPAPAAQHSQFHWPLFILAAWLAGIAALGTHILFFSVRLWRRCARLQPVTDPAVIANLRNCCELLKLPATPIVLESVEVTTPALHGLIHPRLLLPRGFLTRFSTVELRFVFLHELAHLKRRDLWLNWLMAALQVVHWFNPLIWIGFGCWRADREFACDAMALQLAGEERREEYGLTILRLLENFVRPVSTPALVGILQDNRRLRERIGMIASFVPETKWSRLAMILAIALAAIGLTDARNQSSNAPSSIREVTLLNGKKAPFPVTDVETITDGAPANSNTGGNVTILATNHGRWSGIVQYRTADIQRQAQGSVKSFTNLFQLRRILGEEPEAFRFIDCWNAVAQTMPAGITLDTMRFADRTKLSLSGTAPADQVSTTSDFYHKLSKSEKNSQPLFEANTGGVPATQLEPGGSLVRWSFDLDLKEAPKTAENLAPQESTSAAPARVTGFNLTILSSTNYPPGSPWAAFYQVSLEPPETAPAAAAPSDIASELIGTWALVGTPGHVGKVPEAGARLKFFTGKYSCMTQSDPKTGIVMFHHGGTYSLDGDEYTESLEYAGASTINYLGRTNNHFRLKIDDNLLTSIGIDNPWKEVWQRVDDPSATDGSQLSKDLIGTWVLVGSPGNVGPIPDTGRGLKFITASHWLVTQSDPKTGVVVIHHGGTYTLKGNSYTEKVLYADPSSVNFIGREFHFTIKVEGDTLTSTGADNPWNEVWKRAP